MSETLTYTPDALEAHLAWAVESDDPKEIAKGLVRLLAPEDPVELLLVLDLIRARQALIRAEIRRDSAYLYLETEARRAFALKLAVDAGELVKKWRANPAEHHLLRTSSLAIKSLMRPWEQLKSFVLKSSATPVWMMIRDCLQAEGYTNLKPNPDDLGWALLKAARIIGLSESLLLNDPIISVMESDIPSVRFLLKKLNNLNVNIEEGKREIIKIADKHLCILEKQYQQALKAEAEALEEFIGGYSTQVSREWLKSHQSDIRLQVVRFNQILRMFNTMRQQRLRKHTRSRSSGESAGGGPGSGSSSSGSGYSGTSGASARQNSGNNQPGAEPESEPWQPQPPAQPENAIAPEWNLNHSVPPKPHFNINLNQESAPESPENKDEKSDDTQRPENNHLIPLSPDECKAIEKRLTDGDFEGLTHSDISRFYASWDDARLEADLENFQPLFDHLPDGVFVNIAWRLLAKEKMRRFDRSQTPYMA